MRTVEPRLGRPIISQLVRARRMRAYTTGVLRGWAYLLALTLVGGALVLVASGNAVLGAAALVAAVIATWLGEVWVIPGGRDAYARRVRRVVHSGAVGAHTITDRSHDRLGELRHATVVLEPPSHLTGAHQEVCDLMRELDKESASRDRFEDRAVRMHAIREELRRILETLADDSSDPYVVQLSYEVEKYLSELALARGAFQEHAESNWANLTRIRPPDEWKERHAIYTSTVGDYVKAVRSFTAALDDDSNDAIRSAAEHLTSRRRDMDKGTAEYLKDLGDSYVGRQ